jgi:transcriptional regulator with XRE-family HTH domain
MTTRAPSELVGQRIKDLRLERGWTADDLAKRCAEVGAPEITSAVIANIETGRKDKTGRRRRDVTIDEVLKLAYALEVPPVRLFVPLLSGEALQISPEVSEKPFEVLLWVTGQSKPANVSRTQWRRATAELSLYQRIFDAYEDVAAAEGQDQLFESRLRELATVLGIAGDSGLEPPDLPEAWTSRMRAEGWLRRDR